MSTSNETALVDTNVLIYAADETSPFHQAAKELRDKGVKGDIALCICPQLLSEFYAVITDPRRTAQPRSSQEASSEIEKYLLHENLLKIYPVAGVIEKLLELLKRYNIKKQDIFDTHLVATMLINEVTRIYTYNEDDFLKFTEIEVLRP